MPFFFMKFSHGIWGANSYYPTKSLSQGAVFFLNVLNLQGCVFDARMVKSSLICNTFEIALVGKLGEG